MLLRRRRRPAGHHARRVLVNGAALVFCAVWVFPVYWMVNTAFKPAFEAQGPTPVFIPLNPTLRNFAAALGHGFFLVDLRNSLVAVAGTLILSIPLAFLAAAALSRFRFRGRWVLLLLILVVQMLPATSLLIPTFLIFNSLHLLGTLLGLILAYAASAIPISIWILRGFLLLVPVEVEEAARVDGAGTWRVLSRILLPLVLPGVMAASVFAFIAAWNDYLIAYTFMQTQTHYTLPVWLASVGGGGTQMAAATILSVPVVVFFLVVQRNLVTGLSGGAVNG